MSAPSTLTAEKAGTLTVLPGVEISAAGALWLDGRCLGTIGVAPAALLPSQHAAVVPVPVPVPVTAPVQTQRLAAGPRWFAEQVVVAGQCVLLRLRPRPGAWCRWWSARRGEPATQEAALAARWGLPPQQQFSWGVLECGVDTALRGAAVITLRVRLLPAGLPPPARVFWRQRTVAECRALVATAVLKARAAGVWSCGGAGVVFTDGETIPARPGGGEPAQWLPPDFVWQEGLDGAWRVRGERGGWRFTLGYTETAGGPALRWLMARLDVPDAGPWDPLLERELHSAHRRWWREGAKQREEEAAADAAAPTCTGRAVNDAVARTGAELVLEWA